MIDYREHPDVWEAYNVAMRIRKLLMDLNDDSFYVRKAKNNIHATISFLEEILEINAGTPQYRNGE